MLGKLSIKNDQITILLFITGCRIQIPLFKLIVTKNINFQLSTHLKLVEIRIVLINDIQLVFLNDNEEDN